MSNFDGGIILPVAGLNLVLSAGLEFQHFSSGRAGASRFFR